MLRRTDEVASLAPGVVNSPGASSLHFGEIGMLCNFIQQEMHKLESSFANEVQIAKADILASLGQEAVAIQTLKVDLLNSFREDLAGINLHKAQPDNNGSAMMSEVNAASPAEENVGDASRAAPNDDWKDPSEDADHAATNKEWESTWIDLARAVTDIDRRFRNSYFEQIENHVYSPSIWHTVSKYFGVDGLLHWKVPDNSFARIVTHPAFAAMQNLLILGNTCLMAYEADTSIADVLQGSGNPVPQWVYDANKVLSWIFAAEVFYRMFAFGTWFWVAPDDWAWNLFDVVVVLSSLATDYLFDGVNLNFIRTFRILRTIRAVRLIRVLRFFRELRKMLFAILASIRSLLWCFLFLAMTIFMFTLLFLQGLVETLKDMEPSTNTHAYDIVGRYYDSVAGSMLSLLASVTGGIDWMDVREPLEYAGPLYTSAYLVYVLFVIVGVMNVLTGVFLAGADEFVDRNTIVQNQQVKVAHFVSQMLEIFQEVDETHSGEIDFETFNKAMHDETVQAYLAAHEVEPTHARVIFDLLDEAGKGKVDMFDWIMGMVRMMGSAKAVDARIIQRQIGLIPRMLNYHFEADAISRQASPVQEVREEIQI